MNRLSSILYLSTALSLFLVGCDRTTDWNAERKSTSGSAYIRFVHASPNFRAITGIRDSLNIFVRNDKANGGFFTYVSGTTNTNAAPSGAGYFATQPGQVPIRFALGNATNPDSATVYTTTRSLEPGRYYTFVITDSFRSSNPTRQIFLEDALVAPGSNQFSIRLVHAVLDEPAGSAVDLWSSRLRTNLLSNVSIGTATGFLNFPQYNTSSTADTLIVRRAGTTTELARSTSTTVTQDFLLGQKIYTYVFRGSAVAATGNSRARSLLKLANQ